MKARTALVLLTVSILITAAAARLSPRPRAAQPDKPLEIKPTLITDDPRAMFAENCPTSSSGGGLYWFPCWGDEFARAYARFQQAHPTVISVTAENVAGNTYGYWVVVPGETKALRLDGRAIGHAKESGDSVDPTTGNTDI